MMKKVEEKVMLWKKIMIIRMKIEEKMIMKMRKVNKQNLVLGNEYEMKENLFQNLMFLYLVLDRIQEI